MPYSVIARSNYEDALMKRMITFMLVAIPLCANGGLSSDSSITCQYDCLAVERIGQDHYLVARDSWSEVVKLVSAPIASGAPEPVVDGLNAMLAASATGPGSAAASPQEKLGSTALFGSGSIETRIY